MSDFKIKFGKIFWPSLIAGLVVSIIGTLIFVIGIGGLIGSLADTSPKGVEIKENSILHLTLSGEIAERGSTKFNKTSFQIDKKQSLPSILYALKEAEKDEHIKGIYLELDDMNCGIATAQAIRKALKEFNASGKFSVAYLKGEVITQKEYYISSVAKEVYAFPTSGFELLGLGTEYMFFKNTLDKLAIEVQVIRGKNNDFKSAVEPFFRENMSDSARMQTTRILSTVWSEITTEIEQDRKLKPGTINSIANTAAIHRAEDGISYKLFDKVLYEDEVNAILKKKINLKSDEDIAFVDFQKYAKQTFKAEQQIVKNDDPTIAVILAEGEITTDGNQLTSADICDLFRKARKNSSVKTIVFRINSPGGSALASEEIWREVELTNQVKPVIVSMGDVAASGGYYIATASTRIFAEPTTITGSIGVFGMIPYLGNFFESKLGITFDRVATNPHAGFSVNKRLTPEEYTIIQAEVDQIYQTFLERVAKGRGMSTANVNKIARGRVWTGTDAKRIGLVDELGGLDAAIAYAKKQAKLKETKVIYYPLIEENKFEEIIEQFEDQESGEEAKISIEWMRIYNEIKKIESQSGILMKLPYSIRMN